MTQDEVEAILKAPPGDYGRRGRTYVSHACCTPTCEVFCCFTSRGTKMPTVEEVDAHARKEGVSIWWGEDLAIAVSYDQGGRVECVGYGSPCLWQREPAPEPPLWDQILAWFGE